MKFTKLKLNIYKEYKSLMMYYRRKILLSLLQMFDQQLEKIRLQKLLFLLTRQQEKQSFHFVPYKYGCFSFQANADLRTLCKYKLVGDSAKSWQKLDTRDYVSELKISDQTALSHIKDQFGKLTQNELLELTYKEYPYFAINSTIAEQLLTQKDLDTLKPYKPSSRETVLFTIGYQGISLEEYLNKLIRHDINVLCDVRKIPASMKYGFSKSQLRHACEGVGIKYLHFPDVGIPSEKRRHLYTQADYDKLFEWYKSDILTNTINVQGELLNLLLAEKRIALTCFETHIHQCHRTPLAEAVAALNDKSYKIQHI